MREREIQQSLAQLKLGRTEFALVQLLPLVQVAWAEGTIEPAEQAAIERYAREQRLTEPRVA